MIWDIDLGLLFLESRKLFTFGGNEDLQLGHPDKKVRD